MFRCIEQAIHTPDIMQHGAEFTLGLGMRGDGGRGEGCVCPIITDMVTLSCMTHTQADDNRPPPLSADTHTGGWCCMCYHGNVVLDIGSSTHFIVITEARH